jgi:fluoroquinolone resistance protein
MKINETQIFEKLNYSGTVIVEEFEECTFKSCDLSSANLSNSVFIDCVFEDCNLSMVTVKNTAFKTVAFKNCKLLGINFGDCNTFLLAFFFSDCLLNLASFYKLKLKGTKFRNCKFTEADLTEADLSASLFDNCDLSGTIFANTILEKADFRTAFNYSIDPSANRVKKARFSMAGLPGLLDKYGIEIS